MKSLRRLARPVLWLKANKMTKINLAVRLLSRPSKLELIEFEVVRPLLQVTEMQLLWFTLILSKLNLQGAHDNSYEPSRLLIVDEDVELAVSK